MTHHFGERLDVDGRDKPWLRQSKSSKTSAGSVACVFFFGTNMEVSSWENYLNMWEIVIHGGFWLGKNMEINGDCRRVAQQKDGRHIEKNQTYQDSDKVL
jgi:hypothetical protein